MEVGGRPGFEFKSVATRAWPVVAIGAGCCVAALWQPSDGGAVVCPLRATTGVWCPGCGLTRAALALGRFDPAVAWKFHPWVFFLALQFAAFAAVRASGNRSLVLGPRRGQQLMWFNVAALVVVWGIRYSLGAIPIAGG